MTDADNLHRAHLADGLPPIAFDAHGWASGDGVLAMTGTTYGGDCLPETLKQQALAPGLAHIEGITWHYTDTRGCGAENLAKRLLDRGNKRAASWHACIDAAGTIAQSVSAKCGSWHAGGPDAARFRRAVPSIVLPGLVPEWQMLGVNDWSSGYGANSWAFGIELENAGELRLVDGKWCSWPFAFGTKYGAPIVVPEAEVVEIDGKHWHAFTDAQTDGAKRLVAALVATYGLTRQSCQWTHARIDPRNRVDPGPAWTSPSLPRLETVLDAVFA